MHINTVHHNELDGSSNYCIDHCYSHLATSSAQGKESQEFAAFFFLLKLTHLDSSHDSVAFASCKYSSK